MADDAQGMPGPAQLPPEEPPGGDGTFQCCGTAWHIGDCVGGGSFATVYLPDGVDQSSVVSKLAAVPGIQKVYDKKHGCAEFELPEDRLGDLIVVSEKSKVLGTSADRHDLSQLKEPLRSHGGVTEQKVPLIVTRHADIEAGKRLRNFDVFDVALNHTALAANAA